MFKDANLFEKERFYPKETISNVQSKMLSIAKHWYGILCKRGSLGILGIFIKDDFKCTF